MSQAQIAGGSTSASGEYPRRGYRLRDFALPSVDGKQVRPSDYRGRSNLVVIFAGTGETTSPLLAEIGQQYSQLKGEEAQVLAIVDGTRDAAERVAQKLALPFPLQVDQDGHVHRDFGAANGAGRPMPAIYITDRYGEVFGSYRTEIGQVLPGIKEILGWLEFVNSQCPECEPPEWPV